MNVLVLSPYPQKLTQIIKATGDTVTHFEGSLTANFPNPADFQLGISYGYRHIVGARILEYWRDRLINLHISFLPWNRGADPNFWSAVSGTPSGVSIHYIDEGVDTGDLIAQAEVPFEPCDTLATSYERLQGRIIELFAENWPLIRVSQASRWPQSSLGSLHKSSDKQQILSKLSKGWDTPIVEISQNMRKQVKA